MVTTYDPRHPSYVDEADVRAELTRVFDICSGCRQCLDLCASFPTLFDLIDRHADRDAGRLTPADQDTVVDACVHCKRCVVDCPASPDRSELDVDVPRLMLRSTAMQRHQRITSMRTRAAVPVIAGAGTVGAAAVVASPLVNRIIGARAGSAVRRVVAAVTGLSAVRVLPPYARERFSTWFARRPTITLARRQGRVTLYPTCLVEYHEPAIGHDLVKVYERNGIECTTTSAGCCGAALLQAGAIDRFAAAARRNVAALAEEVRAGNDIVVAQPTCSYVLRHDYIDHVGGPDAALVAEHTFDSSEYLIALHRHDGAILDTDFPGEVIDTIAYHAPCHLRVQHDSVASRDLLKLTGADVTIVSGCVGVGSRWGLRAGNDVVAASMAADVGAAVDRTRVAAVAGDCHSANMAITEHTGRQVRHPMQLLARAYGIAEEPGVSAPGR